MSDLLRLAVLAGAIVLGVFVARSISRRNPSVVHHWGWFVGAGVFITFTGLTLVGGEYLRDDVSPADLISLIGTAVIAFGVRLRIDAP